MDLKTKVNKKIHDNKDILNRIADLEAVVKLQFKFISKTAIKVHNLRVWVGDLVGDVNDLLLAHGQAK